MEPVIDSFVTVAEQVRGDRVAVGLVADQDAAEVVAGLGVERFERQELRRQSDYLQPPYDGNILAAYVRWNYQVVKDGAGAITEKSPVGVDCTTNGTGANRTHERMSSRASPLPQQVSEHPRFLR